MSKLTTKTHSHPVKGTQGYSEALDSFIQTTHAISFNELHHAIIDFIPCHPSSVLEVGAGIGRDAYELAQMEHKVTAVEPTPIFLDTAKQQFDHPNIEWIDDALPDLNTFKNAHEQYDFVLASAMWHHLDEQEQSASLQKIAGLMKPNAAFALSLRNGPAGVGTHVFPTSAEQAIVAAQQYGLTPALLIENQPSLIAGKTRFFGQG